MFLSTIEESHKPLTRYQKISEFFFRNSQYLIALVYLLANIVEFYTKKSIHLILGSDKSSGFFVFTLLGFFFLTIAQSGINLLSKKIVQIKKLGREQNTYPLLCSLYVFNVMGCALIFFGFLGMNYVIFGRPEGILSIFLDVPEKNKNASPGSTSLDSLPFSAKYGAVPLLTIIFLQQFTKSLYQPLLAIIGAYRRVFWFAAEKIGGCIFRFGLVYFLFSFFSFADDMKQGIALLTYAGSYLLVTLTSGFGVLDIVLGWRKLYFDSTPEEKQTQILKEIDPFFVSSFISQCAFTVLKTLSYVFVEVYTKLLKLETLSSISVVLHPLSDILVGVGYILTPKLVGANLSKKPVVPIFLSTIIGPIIIMIILVALDGFASFFGKSQIYGIVASPKNTSNLSYLFGLFMVSIAILRGIVFLLPGMGLCAPRVPILFINYFFLLLSFGVMTYFREDVSEWFIATVIFSSYLSIIIFSLVAVALFDDSRIPQKDSPSFEVK